MITIPAIDTPTPMPADAPVLRPEDDGADVEDGVLLAELPAGVEDDCSVVVDASEVLVELLLLVIERGA